MNKTSQHVERNSSIEIKTHPIKIIPLSAAISTEKQAFPVNNPEEEMQITINKDPKDITARLIQTKQLHRYYLHPM